MDTEGLRSQFRSLHEGDDVFIMPNPWDVGSAKILESLGFPALATTSSGFALSLGRDDGEVGLHELLEHVRALTSVLAVPLNVDSERCFAETPAGVAETVRMLGSAGASGCSIEDWNPATGAIDPIDVAAERVAAAASAAAECGMVLTARAENHIRGRDDLDDTIVRLSAYRDAGGECLYAPGLTSSDDIRRVVGVVDAPVNVLLVSGGPTIGELSGLGVRRVSTGGTLARQSYASIVDLAAPLTGSPGS